MVGVYWLLFLLWMIQLFLFLMLRFAYNLLKDIYVQVIDVYSMVCDLDQEERRCYTSLSSDVVSLTYGINDLKSSYDGLSELIVKRLFDSVEEVEHE